MDQQLRSEVLLRQMERAPTALAPTSSHPVQPNPEPYLLHPTDLGLLKRSMYRPLQTDLGRPENFHKVRQGLDAPLGPQILELRLRLPSIPVNRQLWDKTTIFSQTKLLRPLDRLKAPQETRLLRPHLRLFLDCGPRIPQPHKMTCMKECASNFK